MFANIWLSTFSLAALALSDGSLGELQDSCRSSEWNYKGCYDHATLHDGAFEWHLSTSSISHSYPGYQRVNDMTLDLCLTACRGHGFRFASLSNGEDCYCDTQPPIVRQTLDSDRNDNSTINTCHVAPATVNGCAGNKNEWCGSALGADVYEDPSFGDHSHAGDESDYERLGCFTYESPGTWHIRTTTSNLDTCMAYCGKHGYAYVYGILPDGEPDNCGCGTEIQVGLRAKPESQCSSRCSAESDTRCGGKYHVSAYLNTKLQGCFARSVFGTTLGSTSHASEVENQIALTKRDATDPPTAPPYAFVSCWSDSSASRTLRYQLATAALGGDDNQTVENCAYTCNSYGYAYMGVEYFYQCFCDDEIQGNSAADFSNCNTPCRGNSAEQCGGPNFLSLYKRAPQDPGSYSSGTSSSTVTTSTTTYISTVSDTSTSLPVAAETTSTIPPGTVTVTTTIPAGTETTTETTTQPAVTVTATATQTEPAVTVTATATSTTTVQGTVTQTATATYTPSPLPPVTVTLTPSALSISSTTSTTTTTTLSLPIYSTTARIGSNIDITTSTTTSISLVYVTPVPLSTSTTSTPIPTSISTFVPASIISSMETSLPGASTSSNTLSLPGYSNTVSASSTCPARTPSTVYTTVIATMTMTG